MYLLYNGTAMGVSTIKNSLDQLFCARFHGKYWRKCAKIHIKIDPMSRCRTVETTCLWCFASIWSAFLIISPNWPSPASCCGGAAKKWPICLASNVPSHHYISSGSLSNIILPASADTFSRICLSVHFNHLIHPESKYYRGPVKFHLSWKHAIHRFQKVECFIGK